ncbi:unnamed protein product, partial [Heterotrigona itama]
FNGSPTIGQDTCARRTSGGQTEDRHYFINIEDHA